MTTAQYLPQPGVLSDPEPFAEYLTFIIEGDIDTHEMIETAFSKLDGIEKSIRQKAPESNLSLTIGFSHNGWSTLFSDQPLPTGLEAFTAMQDGNRTFPATAGDVFIMVKSTRMDLNFQAAKYCKEALNGFARLDEDIQGFVYLDNRDMIDFVDGTENPISQERIEAVVCENIQPQYNGGSFLTVQRYVHRTALWDSQQTSEQEKTVGRTKLDNIELDDDHKPAWAHNEKSKVEIDGEEIKMFRQNRPFGNALEHGTMFIGFANAPSVIKTSLQQMIYADENGHYDKLLDYVDAKTGANYFVPPISFLQQYTDE
ncbi:putative deferrochelatase/peroxidase YfeX [BD1-7 clade bacterium]|uniref:Putative deferrochelatase/peroxidase YfeX n=1 Tax=BD1-7 clade bacterium TaxID=2029982 RepID=A0A5S9PNJ8_9GAMM|nr:putative deferrochelatase/peroxidase YfeX [BD1-7 clade bacterium]